MISIGFKTAPKAGALAGLRYTPIAFCERKGRYIFYNPK